MILNKFHDEQFGKTFLLLVISEQTLTGIASHDVSVNIMRYKEDYRAKRLQSIVGRYIMYCAICSTRRGRRELVIPETLNPSVIPSR